MYSYVAVDLNLRTGDGCGIMSHASKIQPVRGHTEVEAYATPWEAFAAAHVDANDNFPVQIFRLTKPVGLVHSRYLARRVAEAWSVDEPVNFALAFSELPAVGAQVVKLLEAIRGFASRPYVDGASRTAADFVTRVTKLSGVEAQANLLSGLVKTSSNVIANSGEWDKEDMAICSMNARSATNAAFRLWADRMFAKTLDPLPLVPERMQAIPEAVRLRLEFARAQGMGVAAYSSLVGPSQNRLLPAFLELWERGAVLYQERVAGAESKSGAISLAHISKDLTSFTPLVFKPAVIRSNEGQLQR